MSKKTATAEDPSADEFIKEALVAEALGEPTGTVSIDPQLLVDHNGFNAMTIDAKVQHLQKRCDWLTSELGKVKK